MGNAAGTAGAVFTQLNWRPLLLFKKEARQQSRARCGPCFAHEALHVFFYGLLGNPKLFRDLFVGVTLDQPLDHRPTANRQLKPPERLGD